jgi:uncharacterized protein
MTEREATAPGTELNWLLDDFGARVEHFQQAVILSRDGLTIAASANLRRESAEHFAAGQVRQIIIELEQAFLFITAAGQGSCLAVLCSAEADAGLIAYEMAMLSKRAGPHLASRPRLPAGQTTVK